VLPGGRGEDVNGDTAYTGGHEHPRASVSREPRQYSSLVTQLYRREDAQWKLARRHADTLPLQRGDGVRVGG
jgi:ketosteroid isomerase-like protein